MILAGDLGGTKSNLGLFDVKSGKLVRVAEKRYATQKHSGLEEIITDFLNGAKAKVTAASFGIAGPVVNNRVHATNFPWIVDGAAVAAHLHVPCVRLINDVEAAAYGIAVLEPRDLDTIHAGVPSPQSTQIVIAAGTGLGEGILYWDGQRHIPMATEAGHADFAPNTKQQAELWKFLNERLFCPGAGFSVCMNFWIRRCGIRDLTMERWTRRRKSRGRGFQGNVRCARGRSICGWRFMVRRLATWLCGRWRAAGFILRAGSR
jgi:hypothetical protein